MRFKSVSLGLLAMFAAGFGFAQPFTYQGFLRNGGSPANGEYDFRFRLFSAPTGGSQIGLDITADDLSVQQGLFSVELEFGELASIWTGADRFLEIAARPGDSSDAYAVLSPRVKIRPSPYSFFSSQAPWAGLIGVPAGFADGMDDDTIYSAGAGLQLTGTTFSIATGGVATSMLADQSVTTGKIAVNSITSSRIVDGAVLAVDIADGAVTDAKLSNTGVFAGTYGSPVQTAQLTVNAQGRITGATNVIISGVSPGGLAGGDLSGTYPNPTVARLQGRSVHTAAPSDGQTLKWNAANNRWEPSDDLRDAFWQASDSSIFYNSGNVGIGASSPLHPLHVETNSGDRAIFGKHNAMTGTTYGIYGQSESATGIGVYGRATATTGLAFGGWFETSSPSGAGVYGKAANATGLAYGVFGQTDSPNGTAVRGWASATTGGSYGVQGQSDGASGRGVFGYATSPTGLTIGAQGFSDSVEGTGVFGRATAETGATTGVYGYVDSTSGTAVYGWAIAPTGTTYGVYGRSDSTAGIGASGVAAATTGATYGGRFESASPSGTGVLGQASASTGATFGVYGRSDSVSGRGVFGQATAATGTTFGVSGISASESGRGVLGRNTSTTGAAYGVYGQSDSGAGTGVYGTAASTTGSTATGVHGATSTSASTAYGVLGAEPSGSPGHAVYASGTLAATGTKSFQIDHPLHPETHYLNHFCTEAPEPLNAYSGNAITDDKGYAVVQLPPYFEALNRDFRYQLTVIDSSDDFVQAKVARKIQNNRFVIRTSLPRVEVSWRIEAVRNDRWVQQNGFQTEQEKEDALKGKYLHPELYDRPKEQGIHQEPEPERSAAIPKKTKPAFFAHSGLNCKRSAQFWLVSPIILVWRM